MGGPVGFVGVGLMGEGMVRRLLGGGVEIVVWNRDRSKAELVKSEYPEKVFVAATAAEVVAKCEVTFSMLSTLEASCAVFPEVVAAVCAGKKIVDCATLTPERMGEMSLAVEAKGGTFLEAPVSGSKGPAAAGQLIFLCAGDKALYGALAKEFELMGKANFYFGPVGGGTKMKLVVNMILAAHLATLGEAMALCEASGLPNAGDNGLLKVLDLSVVASPMIKLKGPAMANASYAPNFPLKHMQKDTRFALQLADDLGLAMPVIAAANTAFLNARHTYGDLDFAAIYETQKKHKSD